MIWLMCCDFELAIAGTSINLDFDAQPSVLSVVLVIGMVSILSVISVVLSISILGLPELPFGSGLIWVLACLFVFEATSHQANHGTLHAQLSGSQRNRFFAEDNVPWGASHTGRMAPPQTA